MKTPDSITAPNLYDAGRTCDDRRVVTATKPGEPCHVISPHQGRWPFDKVPRATLMAALAANDRICAAHYFPSFPLNKDDIIRLTLSGATSPDISWSIAGDVEQL